MAQTVRRPGLKQVALSEIRRDISRFLREAADEEIVITRTGVLIGFASQDDWLDYQVENDPRASAAASSRRAAACEMAAASGSRMSSVTSSENREH
jgi:hypothetical protein